MASSAWTPFRHRVFRALWIAQSVSNIGTWMQSVGAVWLMLELKGSPLYVALVQTASALPIVFVGIAAGALADLVDRRRILIVTQLLMLAAAGALALMTAAGTTTPRWLLALTFILGVGTALNNPAWQAIQPELVPKEEFPQAIVLGGASINLGRAIGPALGGLLVALSGPALVFFLNALSFGAVVAVLWWWRRPLEEQSGPPEQFVGAIRAGIRYALFSHTLIGVLVRVGAFALAGAGLLALIPVYSTSVLHLGSAGLGVMLACFGAGAVVAAWLFPRVRAALGGNGVVTAGTTIMAASMIVMAEVRVTGVAFVMTFAAGIGWLLCLAIFNFSSQASLPGWVRGRGLAIYLTILQGGLAVGAALWGRFATSEGVVAAFAWGALAVELTLVLGLRWRFPTGMMDLSPAPMATEGRLSEEDWSGPVLVMVGYDIRPQADAEFLQALRELGRARRRTGAVEWSVYRDAERPNRFVEAFVVATWDEHLRQHGRRTVADAGIQERVRAFLVEGTEPEVKHYVAAPGQRKG